MAKAIGLDAGEFEVKVVELDGSPKRPRLAKISLERVAQPLRDETVDEHAQRTAEAALVAFDEGGFPKEGGNLAFPCREAVLRQLRVPFVGREQIRKVIKFETEGEIHSHNVDDMVVDFLALEEFEGETRVFVAAAPKQMLRASITALNGAGIDPETVDLDAMALFNVAGWCGAFEAGADGEGSSTALAAESDASALPSAKPGASTLVIDLGARSTRILVVANGELVDMRALRTGADSMAEDIGDSAGVGLAQARQAVWESLRTEEDFRFASLTEDADDGDADEANEALVPVDGDGQIVAHDAVASARDRYLARLRRELVRFLASVPTVDRVDAVWMTGGASRIQGVADVLEDVFAVAPRELDVLGGLSHKLSDEEVDEFGPKVAVSVGLALDTLGGRTGFNFRQEDLGFTKGFDRIKFPLAIAAMLALFLVLVYALKSYRELEQLGREYGEVYDVKEEVRRGETVGLKAVFWGYVGCLVNADTGGWFADVQKFERPAYRKLINKLVEMDTFRRLLLIKQEAKRYLERLQQKSGYYANLRVGSGLGALSEASALLHGLEGSLGRFLVTEMSIDMPYQDTARKLNFEIVLRTDKKSAFRDKWNLLDEAVRAACGKRDSAFLEVVDRAGGHGEVRNSTFDSPAGGGAFFRVSIQLKPEKQFPVFPPPGWQNTVPPAPSRGN